MKLWMVWLFLPVVASAQGYKARPAVLNGALVTADSDALPRSVVAQAQSGEYSFRTLHVGALTSFGPRDSAACYLGTDNFVHCGIFTFAQLGVGVLAPATGNAKIDLYGPIVPYPFTLPVCSAAQEFSVQPDGASGRSTGARSRSCLCTSDGGGTPAYAWQNTVTGNLGTTTTCPP